MDVPGVLTGGRRIRQQRKSLQEAKRLADEKYKGVKQNGESFFRLSEQERNEVIDWMPKLRKAGITLPQAAEFALNHLVGVNNAVTLSQFVDDFLEGKKQRLDRGDIRPLTYTNFRTHSAKFVDQFGERPLVEIGASDIKDWLVNLKRGPRTTKNYMSVVAEIFNEAISAGYLARSPLARISKHERKVLCGQSGGMEKEPSVLTVAEAKRLLAAAHEHQELGVAMLTLKNDLEFLRSKAPGVELTRAEDMWKLFHRARPFVFGHCYQTGTKTVEKVGLAVIMQRYFSLEKLDQLDEYLLEEELNGVSFGASCY